MEFILIILFLYMLMRPASKYLNERELEKRNKNRKYHEIDGMSKEELDKLAKRTKHHQEWKII